MPKKIYAFRIAAMTNDSVAVTISVYEEELELTNNFRIICRVSLLMHYSCRDVVCSGK